MPDLPDLQLPPSVATDIRGSSPYSSKLVSAHQYWRGALASRQSAGVNIAVLGDSTEEGTGTTSRLQGWPELLGNLLRARLPTSGETQVSPAPNFAPVFSQNTVPTGWSAIAGWAANFGGYGPTGYTAKAAAAGNTMTYVTPAGVTDFDLLYLRGADATYGFTVSVDGGAATTLGDTTDGGSVTAGRTHSFTGLNPSTTHTVLITANGNNAQVSGIVCYAGNAAQGIRVFNFGHHGTHLDQYILGGSLGFIRANQSPTTLSGVQGLLGYPPDLVIIGGGYNDYNNAAGQTVNTYQANLAAILAGIRATVTTKPVPALIVGGWLPGAAWTSQTSATWADFITAQKTVAAADPLTAHLDLSSVVPQVGSTYATELGLFADANVHANVKGYQMVADAVAGFLVP